MKFLSIVIKRELLAFRKSIITNAIILVTFPLLLFLLLGLPLYKTIHSVEQLNYLYWVTPGIWIITSSFMAFIISFSAMRRIRFEGAALQIYLKSPVSLWTVFLGINLWAFFLGLIQFGIAIGLLELIIQQYYVMEKLIRLILQILPLIFIFTIAGSVFGSWVKKSENQTIITLLLFLFFSLGAGSFIPLQYFPQSYAQAMHYIPIVNGILHTQHILFHQEGSPFTGILTGVIGLVLFLINGAFIQNFFRRK